MYYIGFCDVCGTGAVGIRVCAGAGDIVAMCAECDAVWLDPARSTRPKFPPQPDLVCPLCSGSLRHPPAHWASKEEIEGTAWQPSLVGEDATAR
jgi:hypothetical protein